MRSFDRFSPWFTALLFLVLLPLMFLQIKTPFYIYDEGFALTGARRVLGGEVPYRDFWAIYPPGQFYAIAAVLKVFGDNILAARLYDTLVRILLVAAVFCAARKVSTLSLAWLAAVASAVLLAALSFYSYAVYPALALALWSIVCWLRGLEPAQKGWMGASGLLLGLALLTRWDIGAYAGAGMVASGLLFYAYRPPVDRRMFQPFARLAWWALPALAVAAAGYAAVVLRGSWESLFEQVFAFPATRMRAQRWLAYPSLVPPQFPPSADWLRFYLVILALACCAALSAWLLFHRPERKPRPVEPAAAGSLALLVFGALSFNQALSRYDWIHVTPALLIALLACAGVYAWLRREHPDRWLHWFALVLALALAWLQISPSATTLRENVRVFPPWGCFSTLEASGCIYIDPNQAQAVEYVRALTLPADPLFVGNLRHDQVFVGDSGFYFLAGRPVATRYHEIHPGVVNTLAVQVEMVKELETKHPPLIVLAEFGPSGEPNGSAVSSGVTLLDEYIAKTYRPVAQFGMYHIYQRRSGQ